MFPTQSAARSPGARAPAATSHDPRDSAGRCVHCGAPIESEVGEYCCHGCRLAYEIIQDAGLTRYYEQREEFAPRPERLVASWDAVPVVQMADGSCEARLAIDGLRCASCVWVSERVLESTDGVLDAHVSYANGRATLRWDPTSTGLSEIAGRVAALGYRPRLLGEESRPDRGLLVRLGVAAFAALNIMLLAAALYAGWFSEMAPRFVALFQWSSLVLATPVAIWCAEPFYRGAITGLKAGVLHMDVPIALAVAVLYVQGLVGTWLSVDTYLDSMAMLVALLLAGRVWESHGRRRAAEAAVSLAAVVPVRARRFRDGHLETIPADALVRGDRIQLAAGEEIAADGTVEEGEGNVAMALVTGESEPVRIGPGDAVVAGTVMDDGDVRVVVEAVGDDTVVSRMAEQLRTAADREARPTAADRIAPWFTAATLVIASCTFLVWFRAVGAGPALSAGIAVLVVACPCALALSRPLAAAAGLGAAARRGLLMRSTDGLLDLADVDVCAVDKTGTVTEGVQTVLEASDEVLRIAAGLERASIHPVARAITAEAARRGIPLPPSIGVREEAGIGMEGWVDDRLWRIRSAGPGRVVVESDGHLGGTIRLGDGLRPGSDAAIGALEAEGLAVTLLTGDQRETARRIADRTGVRRVEAEMVPAGKAEWVSDQRKLGHHVLFVGDGINDGPALAEADVGVAMGGGAASSVLVADGVLAGDSIRPLVAGVLAARAAAGAVRWNQRRSLAYNALAVTAAALGWVNPLVAAVLMPLSSGMVLWGASRVEVTVAATYDASPRRRPTGRPAAGRAPVEDASPGSLS